MFGQQISDHLTYLQPLTITAISSRILFYDRLQAAVKLAHQLRLKRGISRSAKMHEENLTDVWWGQVLINICRQVEKWGWFPVDWATVDELFYRSRLCSLCSARQKEQRLAESKLALFLNYIPLLLMGFDDETIKTVPPLDLMRGFLSCEHHPFQISSSTRDLARIHCLLREEGWGDQERTWAWVRLENIEHDPLRYPESLRWLPLLARWSVGYSGNLLLDRSPLPEEGEPFSCMDTVLIRIIEGQDGESHWFSWDEVDAARAAYQEVRRVQAALKRVMDWHEQEPNRLAKLAAFLARGEAHHELDW